MTGTILPFPSRRALPPDAAAKGLAVRQAWAYTKRQLKLGTLPLEAALELEHLQHRTALEVLGYACVGLHVGGGNNAYRGDRPPRPGQTALQVAAAMAPPLTHFVTVGGLSAYRRRELCALLAESGYATARRREASSS